MKKTFREWWNSDGQGQSATLGVRTMCEIAWKHGQMSLVDEIRESAHAADMAADRDGIEDRATDRDANDRAAQFEDRGRR